MNIRLVDYSSDEEQNVNVEDSKMLCQTHLGLKQDHAKSESLLPLPSEIKGMFAEKNEITSDNPEKHGGKIRSFPHERGLWASYIYIHYEAEPEFLEMIDQLKKMSAEHGIILSSLESFHISLSKTLKLRHHWIEPLVDSLRANLRKIFKFKIILQSLEVYENEEKTRTFIGLKVHNGYDSLCEMVQRVDQCLSEYKLPLFYENPSFHLSCASCIGSKAEQIEKIMADLNDIFVSFVSNSSSRTLWVSDIHCKSGNKLYKFQLK